MKKVIISLDNLKKLFFLAFCLFSKLLYAQLPTITSFTPSIGKVGSVVTISGANFSNVPADNIVYFGAVRATVLASSPTSLSVKVPVGATYQPISVTVNNLTTYTNNPFEVTFSGDLLLNQSSFDSVARYSITAAEILISDFDGDGKADIVTKNYQAITILKNMTDNQNTAFALPKDAPTGESNFSADQRIISADLNGDGKLDLITINRMDRKVYILQNNSTIGNISFLPSISYNISDNNLVFGLCTTDLDKDGKPDIIIGQGNSKAISVLKNTSTANNISFGAKVDYPFNAQYQNIGLYPEEIYASDIDMDGATDLIIATNGPMISVYRNISTTGNISFDPQVNYPTKWRPVRIAVGDLDGDGKSDIALTSDSSTVQANYGRFSIVKNTSSIGNISFASQIDYQANMTLEGAIQGIAINDLNGDGKQDLVIACLAYKNISIYKNNSTINNIQFDQGIKLKFNSYQNGVAIGDLNNDGRPDIAASNEIRGRGINILTNKVGIPLPVQLIDFSGKIVNSNHVQLQWQTASERNTSHFDIERSTDGIKFSSIGKILAVGNSSNILKYSFNDDNAHNGINYYKLKLMDMNGEFTYSNTVAIKYNEQLDFKIFTNVINKHVEVQLPYTSSDIQLQLTDNLGREIKKVKVDKNASQCKINIEHLAHGLYYIIYHSSKGALSKPFLVE